MSQIDLKRATVYLRDGYSKTGAVNNVGGYAAAAVSITVDGFTGSVEDGVFVTFGSDPTRFTIVSHTNTLGNTTQIVITPALDASVADNAVVHVGPHSLALKNGEGTFTWTEKRPVEYTKDRGALSEVREDAAVSMSSPCQRAASIVPRTPRLAPSPFLFVHLSPLGQRRPHAQHRVHGHPREAVGGIRQQQQQRGFVDGHRLATPS
jgi:hypothetical protein